MGLGAAACLPPITIMGCCLPLQGANQVWVAACGHFLCSSCSECRGHPAGRLTRHSGCEGSVSQSATRFCGRDGSVGRSDNRSAAGAGSGSTVAAPKVAVALLHTLCQLARAESACWASAIAACCLHPHHSAAIGRMYSCTAGQSARVADQQCWSMPSRKLHGVGGCRPAVMLC